MPFKPGSLFAPRTFPALILGIAFVASGVFGPVRAQQETDPAGAEEATSNIRIAASAICLSVEEHEPVAAADTFAVQDERLYCWTRVEKGKGETIIHAWIHEGTTRARVELPIGSDSWRTYSSKELLPAWTGNWEVKVLTGGGAVLETIPFVVTRREP